MSLIDPSIVESLNARLDESHWDGRGCGTNGSGGCLYCFGPSPASAGEIVETLTPIIAAAVDAARAEAWDEGYRASYDFERGEVYPEPANPYRKATP